jgi:hypothetical protein
MIFSAVAVFDGGIFTLSWVALPRIKFVVVSPVLRVRQTTCDGSCDVVMLCVVPVAIVAFYSASFTSISYTSVGTHVVTFWYRLGITANFLASERFKAVGWQALDFSIA